jgi:hypothetical protein
MQIRENHQPRVGRETRLLNGDIVVRRLRRRFAGIKFR